MTNLSRTTAKIFGETASTTGNDPEIGQFGSAKAGTYLGTKDVATIQSLPAWSNGWIDAVTPTHQFPTLPERTAVDYVQSYQNAYLLQKGVAEWDSGTTYYTGDFCKGVGEGKLYISLADNNINHAVTDSTYWEEFSSGGGLEIGDIGIAPLGINETQNKRRYLNGQVIIQDQYVSFTSKLKSAVTLYPSLACTEQEWQTTVTLSVGGQCGKFVIDDVAGTIRLPKIIMPIQGLTNLANLAEIVEAGLPTHEHNFKVPENSGSGGSLNKGMYNGPGNVWSPDYTTNGLVDSTGIYGNSTTVQQEQVQYPYFIQVATGVEESVDVTREIELNNPFCLLDYKFSEYELDNISWLHSNGQYNAKAVFPDAYDLLLMIYNETATKDGVSVKLSTEAYTDYDFVLNTSDETFRLPLKVALASGKAVVGNGMTLGLTDGTTNAGLGKSNNSNLGYPINIYSNNYGSSIGSNLSGDITGINKSIGVTTDPTKSGMELSDANLYLYFYVGETVQNANLINAGRIEEKLASMIPDNSSLIASYAMPSSTYEDLTLGASGSTYTAPANGWFQIRKTATAAGQYWYFGNNTSSTLCVSTRSQASNQILECYLPARKGDIISTKYTLAGSTGMFRFIYAKGSESEA